MSRLQAIAVTVVLVHGGFVDGAGREGVYGNSCWLRDGPDMRRSRHLLTSGSLAICRRLGPER
jgi:hypothetical protein